MSRSSMPAKSTSPNSTIPPGTPPGRETKGEVREAVSFFKTLLILFVLAVFLRASVVEAFKIPSGSMLPTLHIGDRIFVNKFAYGLRIPVGLRIPKGLGLPIREKMVMQYATPSRGDVVVFTHPDNPQTPDDESEMNIIKRVIGLPGDTIEVRGTSVFINNQKYPEAYAQWVQNGMRGSFGPKKVPEGKLVLLGDNRDQSRDSRFWPSPFLDVSRVKGRAFIIYWSWGSLSRIGTLIR